MTKEKTVNVPKKKRSKKDIEIREAEQQAIKEIGKKIGRARYYKNEHLSKGEVEFTSGNIPKFLSEKGIMGVSQSMYGKYERGETRQPLIVLNALAEIFDVNLGFFLNLIDDPSVKYGFVEKEDQAIKDLLENYEWIPAEEKQRYLMYRFRQKSFEKNIKERAWNRIIEDSNKELFSFLMDYSDIILDSSDGNIEDQDISKRLKEKVNEKKNLDNSLRKVGGVGFYYEESEDGSKPVLKSIDIKKLLPSGNLMAPVFEPFVKEKDKNSFVLYSVDRNELNGVSMDVVMNANLEHITNEETKEEVYKYFKKLALAEFSDSSEERIDYIASSAASGLKIKNFEHSIHEALKVIAKEKNPQMSSGDIEKLIETQTVQNRMEGFEKYIYYYLKEKVEKDYPRMSKCEVENAIKELMEMFGFNYNLVYLSFYDDEEDIEFFDEDDEEEGYFDCVDEMDLLELAQRSGIIPHLIVDKEYKSVALINRYNLEKAIENGSVNIDLFIQFLLRLPQLAKYAQKEEK